MNQPPFLVGVGKDLNMSFHLRQLHAHKHSGHEEAEENTDKSNEKQQEAVEFGNVGRIGAVQDYKAQASHREQEAGR